MPLSPQISKVAWETTEQLDQKVARNKNIHLNQGVGPALAAPLVMKKPTTLVGVPWPHIGMTCGHSPPLGPCPRYATKLRAPLPPPIPPKPHVEGADFF